MCCVKMSSSFIVTEVACADHTRQLMLDGAKNYYSNPLGECMEISKTAISQPVCYENSQRTITDFFNKSCKNLLGKQLKPNKSKLLCQK